MIYSQTEINTHFRNLGLNPQDTIMLHADAGVAGQYIYEDDHDPLDNFITQLLDYFKHGTIIVPTFTYSATLGEVFDYQNDKSKVGMFSERFRKLPNIVHSKHPIFRVSCIGRDAERYSSSEWLDSFGSNTVFHKIYESDAKLVTLGCQFKVTFAHFVEQKLAVEYRFFKNFEARIIDDHEIKTCPVRYFVRDLNYNTVLNLDKFEHQALSWNSMIKGKFGRFNARAIQAKQFFNVAQSLLARDKYALIEQGM